MQPEEHVPLAAAPLHIVLALSRGERHGYGLMQDVDELSAGTVRMGPGTLYGSLKRLLAAGLIEEADGPGDASGDDERRKYYRLTGVGQAVARLEIERLATLVVRTDGRAARRLLGETQP